jgi:hypothetical protein
MKQLIFIAVVFILLFANIKCLKEEIEQKKESKIIQKGISITAYDTLYFHIEDFQKEAEQFKSGLRDGLLLSFSYPHSGVEWDIFTNKQTAFNLNKVDSFGYVKVSDNLVNFQGVLWKQYQKTVYFQDTIVKRPNVYARPHANQYTVIPNAEFNNLSSDNSNRWMQIHNTSRAQLYYDHICGKRKRRFYYNVFAEEQGIANTVIDGNRCIGDTYSYKIIL